MSQSYERFGGARSYPPAPIPLDAPEPHLRVLPRGCAFMPVLWALFLQDMMSCYVRAKRQRLFCQWDNGCSIAHKQATWSHVEQSAADT